jgi:PEP-CTERM motif
MWTKGILAMHVTTRTVGVAILVFGLIGASEANATVTYTPTFSISTGTGTETFTAATGAQTTDFLAQFNIPQFDSALGTLTSLSITVGGSMNAIGSVTNSGAGAATGVNITQNSTFTDNPPQPVGGSLGSALVTDGSASGDTFLLFTSSAQAGTGLGTLASGVTDSGIPLAALFSNQTLNQSSGFDANLLGNGVFGILFATGEYTTTGGSGGNISNSVTTQDNLSLSVTYNYSAASPPPVPEPASLTLMATGVMGIGAAIRRRRKI